MTLRRNVARTRNSQQPRTPLGCWRGQLSRARVQNRWRVRFVVTQPPSRKKRIYHSASAPRPLSMLQPGQQHGLFSPSSSSSRVLRILRARVAASFVVAGVGRRSPRRAPSARSNPATSARARAPRRPARGVPSKYALGRRPPPRRRRARRRRRPALRPVQRAKAVSGAAAHKVDLRVELSHFVRTFRDAAVCLAEKTFLRPSAS